MPLNNIKMRHLNCFLKVALFQSLSKAAECLCLTIPATSRTIKELEEALDVKLFIRSKKGMKSLQQLDRQPTYIHTAADAKHWLGTDDPEQIVVEEV